MRDPKVIILVTVVSVIVAVLAFAVTFAEE